jgi:Protein of unknown function (DUF3788)
MAERAFTDKSSAPSEKAMQTELGGAYPYFKALASIPNSFTREWVFYRSGGWTMKVHDKKKVLFYLVPMKDEFGVNMAIREDEKTALEEDPELVAVRGTIKSAKKYQEGFALRFKVEGQSDYDALESLIKRLIDIRTR